MTTTKDNPLKVVFVIDKMARGGTERQLIELLKGIDKLRFDCAVIMLQGGGELSRKLYGIPGIRVIRLTRKGRRNIIRTLYRLFACLAKMKPDIVHSYLQGTNELCLLIGLMLKIRVVWGVRVSNLDFSDFNRLSRFIFRMGVWLSRFAQKVIFNSEAGRAFHAARGYSVRNMTVIHNGIDTDRYRPEVSLKTIDTDTWENGNAEYRIGIVGRIHPMKSHSTFLKAAALLLRKRKDVRFICVGGGDSRYLEKLRELERFLMLEGHFYWTDPLDDMTLSYNAMDIVSSCSIYGEGFSNAIGEAMACGVPCVVTDIGDSAKIVGETGVVIRPESPESLAEAWQTILDMTKEEKELLCQAARKRILRKFSIRTFVQKTEAVLLEIATGSA